MSDSETIQPIDNQNQLQGVDMRSKSSPQRGEEAFLSEQTRTLGVQVRGEINSHFEEQHLQSCANITRHAEEQHLQSAECWLKTHAVCKTFQPNVGTFNANVVIGKRSIPFHFTNNAMFRAKALNMTNVAYKHSRHTEQSEVSHNRENITNNAILRGLNNYSPQEDGEKSCRLMRGEVGKSKCKAAFTLAETLITLGIIGVVAVMTIPNIIVAHQKKLTSTRVKSAYSQLTQAIQLAQAEYGDISNWDEADISGTLGVVGDTQSVKIFADKYILPYLKLTSVPEASTLKSKGYYNGIVYNNKEQYVGWYYNYYFAELANGSTLMFSNNGNGTTGVLTSFTIVLDVNGCSGENRIGRDIFLFAFVFPKGIKSFFEDKDKNWLFNGCKNGKSAFSCSTLLMKNNWEIDKNYPW